MDRVFPIHQIIPPGLVAAFYKGNRDSFLGLQSRLGRLLDHGPYSHTEIIFPGGLSASASLEDKGVRFKHIRYSNANRWDFLPIPDPTGNLCRVSWRWHKDHEGLPYDIWGNVRFLTNLVSHSEDKWFCSEANMASLGYPQAWRYGPSGMAVTLQHDFKTQIIKG